MNDSSLTIPEFQHELSCQTTSPTHSHHEPGIYPLRNALKFPMLYHGGSCLEQSECCHHGEISNKIDGDIGGDISK